MPRARPTRKTPVPVDVSSDEYFLLSSGTHKMVRDPAVMRAWIGTACAILVAGVLLVLWVLQRAEGAERLEHSEAMVAVLNKEVDSLQQELRARGERLDKVDSERRALRAEKDARDGELETASQRLAALKAAVEAALPAAVEAGSVRAEQEGARLRIVLSHELLFEGDVRLQASGVEALKRIAALLARGEERVHVVAHTDNGKPRARASFSTNWSLSAARAAAVTEVLEQSGIRGKRLVAAGQGDERPLASNGSAKGRAKNRRVELIVTPAG